MQSSFQFPDPDTASRDGLLCWGGDLSPATLLQAYSKGIFPWFNDDEPILWWSPNPRFILFPDKLKVSKSLQKTIRENKYEIRFDTAFRDVVEHCKNVSRYDQLGTWITDDMVEAYCNLHELGFAHSVEAYYEGKLVGGLYGISIGRVFCGESMFHLKSDASKVAFYYLIEFAKKHQFHFIDAQTPTTYLASFGAECIPRKKFLKLLSEALEFESLSGKWRE
ncbi:MAG: leucyl/phenylalanyl-tRNA--protein transferase [Bacteroidetes bacterium RIFOXYA12_FULL_35_11]|nr:MAG: leucyl/phenylalanyl-tRNA--protein transferase [Bacteroidetes bacterium GWF2_35_48]OFY72576.1 MAG: leucyl/phenylalanyl-tRNA--protein transferase [Bacteroidetes bacterium RIFOXYA12_FULL_35_11]OFY95690.1 MAG: leucyl/phenylalanyl-tRNA--protein transferase [Bacteroidetes bacterium RIFOXYC12_FULL_35_7]HBX49556.1 leucyl/phenylalanyl-tRNA--protein transferase [Bacteroidales bacterium]